MSKERPILFSKEPAKAIVLKEDKYNIDKFNEIYATDRFAARIYAFEKGPHTDYVLLNEQSRNVFQIFYTQHTYGVSKTFKRYVSRKSSKKIFVNIDKFYCQEKKLVPLMLVHLDETTTPILSERFGWIRFLMEWGFGYVPFNTIVRKGLYSRDKVLRHLFNCPAEKALLLFTNHRLDMHQWRQIAKSSFNQENLNPDLLKDTHILTDAANLAWKLNKRVNLAWSARRLNEEHDKWSEVYTKYVIELDDEPLIITKPFLDFNEFIGGGLISQSGELANEGYVQQHCVASYKDIINSGGCAIFHINGYTAQLSFAGNKMKLAQLRGRKNSQAPKEFEIGLINKIDAFNETVKNKNYNTKARVLPEPDWLPF